MASETTAELAAHCAMRWPRTAIHNAADLIALQAARTKAQSPIT